MNELRSPQTTPARRQNGSSSDGVQTEITSEGRDDSRPARLFGSTRTVSAGLYVRNRTRTCVSSSPAHIKLEIYPQIRCRASLFAPNEAAADSTPVYTLTSPLNCRYLWLSVLWTHRAGCYHLVYWWRAPHKPPFITRKLLHYPEIRLWFPVSSHREMLRLSGDGVEGCSCRESHHALHPSNVRIYAYLYLLCRLFHDQSVK